MERCYVHPGIPQPSAVEGSEPETYWDQVLSSDLQSLVPADFRQGIWGSWRVQLEAN